MVGPWVPASGAPAVRAASPLEAEGIDELLPEAGALWLLLAVGLWLPLLDEL
jgi:hypothetical protein